MARIRRTKKEVLQDELIKIDSKITELSDRISSLMDQKEQILSEIRLIEEEAARAEEEAKTKEILALIQKKKISLEAVKKLLEEHDNNPED